MALAAIREERGAEKRIMEEAKEDVDKREKIIIRWRKKI